MKKALLWLCPLACLALACLYAYSWFTRDPLAVAFERIEVGMTMEEAAAIMGRPADEIGLALKDNGITQTRVQFSIWNGERHAFNVWPHDGRVESTDVWRTRDTILDKVCKLVWNPSSLLAPPPMPVPAAPIYAVPVGAPTEVPPDREVEP